LFFSPSKANKRKQQKRKRKRGGGEEKTRAGGKEAMIDHGISSDDIHELVRPSETSIETGNE
jgi:hypothetical protein